METKQDGQVIYLKELLFSALYQWRRILVWGIILAVLLGGIKGIFLYRSMNDGEQSAQQASALEAYEILSNSLQQQIEANRASALYQQKYLGESVLMNIDAYHYCEVSMSLFLETDYQIVPGMSYQNPNPANAILRAYIEGITNNTNTELLAESIGTQQEYLLELFSVDIFYEAQSISFYFKVLDQESGDRLAECLRQVVGQLQQDISQTVAPHEMHINDLFTRMTVDPTIAQRQQDELTKLTSLQDAFTNLQQQKNALVPPESPVVSGKGVLKGSVVFAVIGGVLGVMLGVMVAWMGHIFGGTVYSCKALTSRTGIKVIGSIKAGKKRNAVDTWLQSVEGRNNIPADKQNAMLACSVAAAMGNEGVLQITGQCRGEERTAFAEAFSKTNTKIVVRDAGNLLEDVSARQSLNQADYVLLIEQCGTSTYARVQEQVNVIIEHGKKILGCVLIDG